MRNRTSQRDLVLAKLRELDLRTALPSPYAYAGVPQCIIDAVFSIGAKYASTSRVVEHYCSRVGVPVSYLVSQGPPDDEHLLSDFLQQVRSFSSEQLARTVFRNRQRTSTRNGILKAEVVVNYARVLKRHGIEDLSSARKSATDMELDAALRSIKGQASGVSTKYFFMLVGVETLIKPDRMIRRFLHDAMGSWPSLNDAQRLLTLAVSELRHDHPKLTARSLDHAIWKYQKSKKGDDGRSSAKIK